MAAAGESKTALAKRVGISRSSLYYQRKIPEKDEQLRWLIEEVLSDNPGYGYRRVALALGINAKRARRVMRKFGLRPLRRAKAPRKLNDIGRPPTNRPDILALWCPIEPDIVWVSDFTFIRFHDRFLYLTTVLDAFTGEVLGFNVSDTHDSQLVLTAIKRAYEKAGKLPEWFHSDQGSEFDSETVCNWLTERGVKLSNSPKSSPWRNGEQESFFGRFKVEFGDFERFATVPELLEEIYYMLYYFTELRIKNRLKMSPAAFRRKWQTQRSALLAQRTQQSRRLPSLKPRLVFSSISAKLTPPLHSITTAFS